jgi:hypothetical protein
MPMLNLIIFNAMKLKRIQLIFLFLALIIHFNALPYSDPGKNADARASINWKVTSYDFGKIEQNIPVTIEFEFENNSLVPLIINYVRPTCGCTVADYPKEPVQPGKSSRITINYNARNLGHFTKSVIVSSNASEGDTQLVITGEVIKD